jgi:exodeoxyribonuclease V gamma subunit
MLVHGNHPENLRELLIAWVRRYPLAPLEDEVLLVHSNGIAQWLRLALAESEGGCGIAACLDMSLPSRFLWQAYRAVLGHASVPESSPFDKPLLIWRLMRLLPELIVQPVYAPLARFLARDDDLRKRYQLAERLADLFDQYQVYRADWLAAWAAGEDVLIRADGASQPLAADHRWQACLWRALLEDVAGDERGALASQGRAAVHEAFLEKCRNWPEGSRPAGLPRRIIVFGISALPRQSLEALAATARWTQVLMCVHNPCQHYWADIVADKDLLRATLSRQKRRRGVVPSEEDLHLYAQPLLAAWGKQGRDFIGLLDEYDSESERARYQNLFEGRRIDLFSSHGEARLLNQLQDDIFELRALAETRTRWPAVDPADDSIHFQIAHSPLREIEALHDQLLAAFNADASLRARDVIVMVPDIDVYAPLIQAVFGLYDRDDSRYIPFSIADQGQRHHDPLLEALEKLLNLPSSRIAVSDVLDLLEVPALRHRFGLNEDDLPLLHRWIYGASVRWGLSAEHRQSLALPGAMAANTWLFGLRRMLLGYAQGGTSDAWHEIEAFDEIGGLDAALLGPLVQLIERLEAGWKALREEATPAQWCEKLRALLADFFAAETDADAYTLLRLDEALQSWQQACSAAGLVAALPLAVVSEHWLAQLDDKGLTQRFFAGSVTFATLMPMRAIPFRQVCLLGMNDGDYPRSRAPVDFDLMGRDYRPGDRSRREDDRYLFLEAMLSARERLLISWVGRSINDNTPRPPSVLVSQLRDHLASGWRLAGSDKAEDKGGDLLDALTVEHRLQPFSLDYFPGEGGVSRLFSYAREWRQGEAPAVRAAPALPFDARDEALKLADLAGFLRYPVKTFFRQRLNVSLELEDPVSEDQEPFALDGLRNWALSNELIAAQKEALERGTSREEALDQALARIARRGELPAGAFAGICREALAKPMQDLFERYGQALARWPLPAEECVVSRRASGQCFEDRLSDLRADGDGALARVVLEASDLVDRQGHYRHHTLIRHWVGHLAGNLGGEALTTLVVGKVGSVEFAPLSPERAAIYFDALLRAWGEGMTRPLPLAVKTGFASIKSEADAKKCFEGGHRQTGEVETDAHLARAWPDYASLAASGEFTEWVDRLLRPLYDAIFVQKGGKSADSGDRK